MLIAINIDATIAKSGIRCHVVRKLNAALQLIPDGSKNTHGFKVDREISGSKVSQCVMPVSLSKRFPATL